MAELFSPCLADKSSLKNAVHSSALPSGSCGSLSALVSVQKEREREKKTKKKQQVLGISRITSEASCDSLLRVCPLHLGNRALS